MLTQSTARWWSMLLFTSSNKVMQVPLVVMPPASSDVLAIVETFKGHCWMLIYWPKYSAADMVDLKQLADEPTRGGNVIAVILNLCSEQWNDRLVQPPVVNGDHNFVIVCVKKHSTVSVTRCRVEKYFSTRPPVYCILPVSFQLVKCFSSCLTVNDSWNTLYAALTKLINDFMPK
jgi:hypothetical protein